MSSCVPGIWDSEVLLQSPSPGVYYSYLEGILLCGLTWPVTEDLKLPTVPNIFALEISLRCDTERYCSQDFRRCSWLSRLYIYMPEGLSC